MKLHNAVPDSALQSFPLSAGTTSPWAGQPQRPHAPFPCTTAVRIGAMTPAWASPSSEGPSSMGDGGKYPGLTWAGTQPMVAS